jgi:hypothetical protein
MKLESKFDINEWVFTIYEGTIIKREVRNINFVNNCFHYELLIKTAGQLLGDKPKILAFEENNIFKSIDELAAYYKQKLD